MKVAIIKSSSGGNEEITSHINVAEVNPELGLFFAVEEVRGSWEYLKEKWVNATSASNHGGRRALA